MARRANSCIPRWPRSASQQTDRAVRSRRSADQSRRDRQDFSRQQSGRRRAGRLAHPLGSQRSRRCRSTNRYGRWNATATGFRLVTPRRRRSAAGRVILTTGGQSYPGSGTTGDGYRFAAQFGHTIVPPRPALVPLTTTAPWVLDLRGVTLPDVTLSILEAGRPLASRRSSLLFAHFGLTGPAALDVSRVVSAAIRGRQRSRPEIDLLPASHEAQLVDWLRQESARRARNNWRRSPLSGCRGAWPRSSWNRPDSLPNGKRPN